VHNGPGATPIDEEVGDRLGSPAGTMEGAVKHGQHRDGGGESVRRGELDVMYVYVIAA
jgi:hypothetical protein